MQTNRRLNGTGSVSQRRDGSWTARLRIGVTDDGKAKIKAFYGQTEADVIRKLDAYKELLDSNELVDESNIAFARMLDDWLICNKRNVLKPKSYDRLEQTVNFQVKPYLGHLRAGMVRSSHVQQMVNELWSQGYSHSTIKKAYDAVNGCFRIAVQQQRLKFNPALGVTMPAKHWFPEKEIKCFDADEALRICDAATSCYPNGRRIYRLGDFVAFALNTGLRMAELLALRWTDVDFDRRMVCIHTTRVAVKDRSRDSKTRYVILEQRSTKTAAGKRSVWLNNDALQALRSLYLVTGRFEYVLSTEDGNPISHWNLDRSFRTICQKAGLPKERIFGVHALRHTFASRLFGAGVDVKTVSELLGHANVTTTYNIYIHLADSQKQQALEKIACW